MLGGQLTQIVIRISSLIRLRINCDFIIKTQGGRDSIKGGPAPPLNEAFVCMHALCSITSLLIFIAVDTV